MKKLINRLLLVAVMVFIGNMLPSKASANMYSLGINNAVGTPIYLYVSMYPDEAQSSVTPTHNKSQIGVLWDLANADSTFNSMDAQIFDGATPLGAKINYDIYRNSLYYPNGHFVDPVFPQVSNGTNLMKLIGPGPTTDITRTYDLFIGYTFSNTAHSMRIPFYSLYPKVDVNAYDLTTGTPVPIPKNTSNITTSAITPSTPIRLWWNAIGNNSGFNCYLPNGLLAGVNKPSDWYPSSNTTIPAAAVSTLYPFHCVQPTFFNVTTSKLSNVTRYSVDVEIDVDGTSGLPTEVGVAWVNNIFPPDYPTAGTYDSKVISTSPGTTKHFTTTISGLMNQGSGTYAAPPLCYWEGTHYYIRGYAKNNLGTTYGNTKEVILQGYGC